MFNLFLSTLTQGLIYAILVFGIYITYKILDFPDLTVDGSFPFGAALTALLITKGVNAYLTLPISFIAGALAGFVTGIIHVKLKVRDLLAGIITMTALYSINLQIASANKPIPSTIYKNVFTLLPFSMPNLYKKLIFALIFAVCIKLLLDLFFKTKTGMLLRAVGNNPCFVTTLAKDSGKVKILGLSIANGLVALCGSLVCQEQGAYNVTMGTGQMVFGLAAVLIGLTIFKKLTFIKGTTCALVGSIVYKLCIQIAIQLGLPSTLMNLLVAVIFLIILAVGNLRKRSASND